MIGVKCEEAARIGLLPPSESASRRARKRLEAQLLLDSKEDIILFIAEARLTASSLAATAAMTSFPSTTTDLETTLLLAAALAESVEDFPQAKLLFASMSKIAAMMQSVDLSDTTIEPTSSTQDHHTGNVEFLSSKRTFGGSDGALEREITIEEVHKALEKVKGRTTASGADELSCDEIADLDPEKILTLFNYCLNEGVYPKTWNIVHIIPLLKPTTKKDDPSTYRGITLEPCLLKLYTTIVAFRFEEWAAQMKILPKEQQGFRKNHRTENSTFLLHTILQECHLKKKDVNIAFVDIMKAFDSVPREKMWCKLRDLGAAGKIHKLNIIILILD